MDASATPNALLVGSRSGVPRQIDILVDARWENGSERRIIFDAKHRSQKLDIGDVDKFVGPMIDVRAARGVLVCTNGWTEGAEKRAREVIDLRLLSAEQAEGFDFAAIDPCPNCLGESQKLKGVVFWDGQFPLPLGGWAIVFTGKCDGCRILAFWCWDCGEKVVVPDGVGYECGCGRAWLTEEERDEVLFAVQTDAGYVPLDRRPLR